MTRNPNIPHCDQCEAARINGIFCHETGCPNSRKTWVPDREEWVRFIDCRDCGFPVEEGESCDCGMYNDETTEHCDSCCLPLEPGQTGLCDSCQEESEQ